MGQEHHSNLDYLADARRFLEALGTSHVYQTFHDRKPPTQSELARVITTAPALPELMQLHAEGAGVYVTVNGTDGTGRKSENITHVRAVWQEDDGGFQGAFPIEPSMVVESSPGHFHRYWLVGDAIGQPTNKAAPTSPPSWAAWLRATAAIRTPRTSRGCCGCLGSCTAKALPCISCGSFTSVSAATPGRKSSKPSLR